MTLGEEAIYQYLQMISNDYNEVKFEGPSPHPGIAKQVENPELLENMTLDEVYECISSLIKGGYLLQKEDRMKVLFRN